MISVGDKLPDVRLVILDEAGGPTVVGSAEILGQGLVVIFGVPGAFTRTCSNIHLPGYSNSGDSFSAKGVNLIGCIGVNDAFVMSAWGKALGVHEPMMMLADGNAELARAFGVDVDRSDSVMGIRSKRYAGIVADGVISYFAVETGSGVVETSAEAILNRLGDAPHI